MCSIFSPVPPLSLGCSMSVDIRNSHLAFHIDFVVKLYRSFSKNISNFNLVDYSMPKKKTALGTIDKLSVCVANQNAINQVNEDASPT